MWIITSSPNNHLNIYFIALVSRESCQKLTKTSTKKGPENARNVISTYAISLLTPTKSSFFLYSRFFFSMTAVMYYRYRLHYGRSLIKEDFYTKVKSHHSNQAPLKIINVIQLFVTKANLAPVLCYFVF